MLWLTSIARIVVRRTFVESEASWASTSRAVPPRSAVTEERSGEVVPAPGTE